MVKPLLYCANGYCAKLLDSRTTGIVYVRAVAEPNTAPAQTMCKEHADEAIKAGTHKRIEPARSV
jgi:hypothetical protein